ncbi:MAG: DUF2238 domain-containing protein [Steroidobacteraceae bacterium]
MAYPCWLLAAFGVFWLALAIRPLDRTVWLTENALTVAAVAGLLATGRSWPLSNLSYTLIAAFLVLHTIGGHYTYVRVPCDAVTRALFGFEAGRRWGWTRNHYDRVVHLCFGLLVAYPVYEMLERYARPTGAWSYVVAPALIMAGSLLYELVEWQASALLGSGAGADYLGAQGDEWDAQKDMALATVGSVVSMVATGIAS